MRIRHDSRGAGRHRLLNLAALLAAVALALAGGPAAALEGIRDAGIEQAVERQLRLDQATDVDRIDVEVTDGVVSLTGIATSVLARERATQIAETVKGVRAVSNRVRVWPTVVRTDAGIREAVVLALRNDSAFGADGVDVAVNGNVVTLTGTVGSFAEKTLVGEIAAGVPGAVAVENRLLVEPPVTRADEAIRDAVKRRLRWDALVEAGMVDVAVEAGRVALSGTVGSAAEKRRAETDAWVEGVRAVNASALRVSAGEAAMHEARSGATGDAAIAQAIRDAMRYDPRVIPYGITASVEDGVATLRGDVRSLAAKRAAGSLARHTTGVREVRNEVVVRPLVQPTDPQIESMIDARLAENPVTVARTIDAHADGGRVVLTGSVENGYARAEAERVAASVTGVVEVRNALAVIGARSWRSRQYVYPGMLPEVPLRATAEAGDAEIQAAIRQELEWSPFVDAESVIVTVRDGRATLTGTVATWRAYRAAEENALEAGAIDVENDLKVRFRAPIARGGQ